MIRARDAFRRYFPDLSSKLTILLEKNLPVASGIGGGSSDAAATLRCLARLNGLPPVEAIKPITKSLGADVSMCLVRKRSIARGVGDDLAPVSNIPMLHFVLITPPIGISTPEVFGRLARRANPPLPSLQQTDRFSPFVNWLEQTRNDLDEPARQIAPVIGEAVALLTGQGASFARMSGSGATCFGLFVDARSARRAGDSLRKLRPSWFVAATEELEP